MKRRKKRKGLDLLQKTAKTDYRRERWRGRRKEGKGEEEEDQWRKRGGYVDEVTHLQVRAFGQMPPLEMIWEHGVLNRLESDRIG
jgi:hypothetical protein